MTAVEIRGVRVARGAGASGAAAVTAVERTRALLADLRRDLARLTAASARACEARARLPPGSSRARVTTANARWASAAEARDRVEERIEVLEREAGEGR